MKRSTLQGGALFEGWECAGLPGLPFPENPPPAGQPEARSSILGQRREPISGESAQNAVFAPAVAIQPCTRARVTAALAYGKFEDWLRDNGYPFVAVTEARKAVFNGGNIQAFDYVVYSAGGPNHLIYILGEGKQPTGHHRGIMDEWERIFGEGFEVRFIRPRDGGWECRKLDGREWFPYTVDNDEPIN